jgi:hypothetical protein
MGAIEVRPVPSFHASPNRIVPFRDVIHIFSFLRATGRRLEEINSSGDIYGFASCEFSNLEASLKSQDSALTSSRPSTLRQERGSQARKLELSRISYYDWKEVVRADFGKKHLSFQMTWLSSAARHFGSVEFSRMF